MIDPHALQMFRTMPYYFAPFSAAASCIHASSLKTLVITRISSSVIVEKSLFDFPQHHALPTPL
jgi:hypothetical protein